MALNMRTEGTGLNATARVLGVSKNSILSWEGRMAELMPTLKLYALAHQYVEMLIEGDELYTRVEKNLPANQSQGWTILLMDRASRFIWELKCGKKDLKLFEQTIAELGKVIDKTDDITLLTDGEKRYGSVLFQICHEVLRNGMPGRPPKVLRKGVKVRRKNKGSQAHKRGRKSPKYEAPCKEHPETVQAITNKQIHANHAESFNASLRRRNSAYRRKTNTYAKYSQALQRTLDIHWIIHNFVRPHFTTGTVPAVALGIIDKGFTVDELFYIRKAA